MASKRISLTGILLLLTSLSLEGAEKIPDLRVTPVVRAVQQALPTVVNLSTSKNISVRQRPRSLFRSPFDELFFPGARRTYKQTSLGSGVLIDGDGHILTNNHVIAFGDFGPADEITAHVHGEPYPRQAYILGTDPAEDLAVLRLEGKPPANFLPFGRSDDLMVGETVIAIGNALGNSSTVTQGIVSYIGRRVDDGKGTSLSGLIQTDADINPGNSGGPLININAEIIGINAAISTPSGGSVGLGFAIPANRARQVYEYVVHKRLSLAARLRIRIVNMDGDLKQGFFQMYPELSGDERLPGVFVEAVNEGPLEGQVKPSAVITHLQGRRVRTTDDFELLDSERDLKAVKLKYCYRGKFVGKTIRLEDAASTFRELDWNGMTVQDLDEYWCHKLSLSRRSQGVVVTAVKRRSSAYRAGIRPGDLITGMEQYHSRRKRSADLVNLDQFEAAMKLYSDRERVVVYLTRILNGRAERFHTEIEN